MTTPEMPELVPLSRVPHELLALIEGEPPAYRQIWLSATDGRLPMLEFIRNRWYCPRPELPRLAQALGLRLRRGRARPAATAGKRPRSSVRRSAA
jgi:hypothetical protein